jgi:hypothetical protein
MVRACPRPKRRSPVSRPRTGRERDRVVRMEGRHAHSPADPHPSMLSRYHPFEPGGARAAGARLQPRSGGRHGGGAARAGLQLHRDRPSFYPGPGPGSVGPGPARRPEDAEISAGVAGLTAGEKMWFGWKDVSEHRIFECGLWPAAVSALSPGLAFERRSALRNHYRGPPGRAGSDRARGAPRRVRVLAHCEGRAHRRGPRRQGGSGGRTAGAGRRRRRRRTCRGVRQGVQALAGPVGQAAGGAARGVAAGERRRPEAVDELRPGRVSSGVRTAATATAAKAAAAAATEAAAAARAAAADAGLLEGGGGELVDGQGLHGMLVLQQPHARLPRPTGGSFLSSGAWAGEPPEEAPHERNGGTGARAARARGRRCRRDGECAGERRSRHARRCRGERDIRPGSAVGAAAKQHPGSRGLRTAATPRRRGGRVLPEPQGGLLGSRAGRPPHACPPRGVPRPAGPGRRAVALPGRPAARKRAREQDGAAAEAGAALPPPPTAPSESATAASPGHRQDRPPPPQTHTPPTCSHASGRSMQARAPVVLWLPYLGLVLFLFLIFLPAACDLFLAFSALPSAVCAYFISSIIAFLLSTPILSLDSIPLGGGGCDIGGGFGGPFPVGGCTSCFNGVSGSLGNITIIIMAHQISKT